jgi:hypothetical protein
MEDSHLSYITNLKKKHWDGFLGKSLINIKYIYFSQTLNVCVACLKLGVHVHMNAFCISIDLSKFSHLPYDLRMKLESCKFCSNNKVA